LVDTSVSEKRAVSIFSARKQRNLSHIEGQKKGRPSDSLPLTLYKFLYFLA
jgi:hypothetical protein